MFKNLEKSRELLLHGLLSMYLGKFPQWKADKWCDDDNNNCEWDGGDCCGTENKYKAPYCTECKCKDPSASKPGGGGGGPPKQ